MGEYVKKKKEMKYSSLDSLQNVVNVVNDASIALSDPNRTIKESSIPEVLAGVVGAGVGGVISFSALYGLGTVGLSAAGITSGLAAAGGVASSVAGAIGVAVSPMVAGIFVLATPVAVVGALGVGFASHAKNKQLKQEKERLYQEALRKHQAIIIALKTEVNQSNERAEYLNSLNVLLQAAIRDLQQDLGI